MRRALFLLCLLAPALLLACPTPKLPTGPAPEYEDPPPPSWLEGGAPPPPSAPSAPADAAAG